MYSEARTRSKHPNIHSHTSEEKLNFLLKTHILQIVLVKTDIHAHIYPLPIHTFSFTRQSIFTGLRYI